MNEALGKSPQKNTWIGRTARRCSVNFSLALRLVFVLSLWLGIQPAYAEAPPEADLVVLNRPIFRFRSTIFGISPNSRAKAAELALAEALSSDIDAVEVRQNDIGDLVIAGGRFVFFIVNDDVDKLAGQTREQLVAETVRRLRQVMAESRESRNAKALVEAGIKAVVATVVMLLMVTSLIVARRWAMPRLVRLATQKSPSQDGELRAIWIDRATLLLTALFRTMLSVATIITIYVWLGRVMRAFAYTRAWGERLDGYFANLIFGLAHGIVSQVPNLLTAAAMFLVAFWATRLVRPFLDRIEQGAGFIPWLDRDTVRPTRQIVNVLIWLFALVMAYPYLPGAETEAFKGVSVLVGLMVSLGAGSVVGQAASGLILMYSRTLKAGDYVKVGEHEGTIVRVGMFLTRLRTGRGSEVTLPNSIVFTAATVNYSRTVTAGYALDTTVTIGYDAPWRQVEAMLKEAAQRTTAVAETPAPHVFQTALSDFYAEYCLVCAARPGDPRARAEALSELHRNIQDVFNEYGVQIMSPHYLADPAAPKVVPPAMWSPAPAQPSQVQPPAREPGAK
jgi:small-conductance mechanosensitive channel